MRRVQPLVVKLAESAVDLIGVQVMLRELGVSEETVQRWVSDPESAYGQMLIELAGRTCYKSFEVGLNPNVTKIRQDSAEYFQNVLKKGDGSIFEHATVTFAFLNVSRVFTHELVRHRVGVAISQESLRYVRPTDLGLWLPPGLSEAVVPVIEQAFLKAESAYREMELTEDWKNLPFDQKKALTSLFRRVLPNGMATNIIWTANHRTLRWVVEARTSPEAEIEIRIVFDQVAKILKHDYPLIYGDFERTENSDGTGTWRPKLRSKV